MCVACADAEPVGGSGGQRGDRRRAAGSGVSGVGPGRRSRLSVADVVAGDRGAGVARRGPGHADAAGAGRAGGDGGRPRRRVRRSEARRPCAGTGAVAGAHADDVGRARGQAGDGRGGGGALEGVVGPGGVHGPPVAHVVVGHRTGRGCRPSPGERQAGGAGGARQEGRRRRRGLQPQDQFRRRGERAVAGGVAGADAHQKRHAGLGDFRPNGRRGAGAGRALLRPGDVCRGAVAHRVAGDRRARVRRRLPGDQHRLPARRQRQRGRRRLPWLLVRRAAAGWRVRPLAGGVPGPHLHFVGDAGGEVADGGGGAGALEGVRRPVRGGAAVADVVARDRAAGVRRRRPGDVQGAAAGGGRGRRRGASGHFARSRRRRQREGHGSQPPSPHGASLLAPLPRHSPIGNAAATCGQPFSSAA